MVPIVCRCSAIFHGMLQPRLCASLLLLPQPCRLLLITSKQLGVCTCAVALTMLLRWHCRQLLRYLALLRTLHLLDHVRLLLV